MTTDAFVSFNFFEYAPLARKVIPPGSHGDSVQKDVISISSPKYSAPIAFANIETFTDLIGVTVNLSILFLLANTQKAL